MEAITVQAAGHYYIHATAIGFLRVYRDRVRLVARDDEASEGAWQGHLNQGDVIEADGGHPVTLHVDPIAG